MYDYLIVGCGLFGAVCARQLTDQGKKVLIIDRRDHIGGNVYTENVDGINVHKYGAHIFHTNDKEVWDYVNKFADFNRFTNSPLAKYEEQLFNLPFNMNTFYQLWGAKTPEQARAIIEQQKSTISGEPKNLEEQAISLVGYDIYQKFIKGYTEKQWGRPANELPAFIIKRIPVRFTFDNNYFSDRYQGIPIGGYTKLIENLVAGIDVKLKCDFFKDRDIYVSSAKTLIYTGPIDEFFDYSEGVLEYRSLKFENERLPQESFQGNAVVNYTESCIPFTRIIEHKHFDDANTDHTIITKEYPVEWTMGLERYYPVNDKKNMDMYNKYRLKSKALKNVIFGGRLAEYKYYDMHQVISSAFYLLKSIEE